MNKTWIVIESSSGLCDGKDSNCHLCGICDIENGRIEDDE